MGSEHWVQQSLQRYFRPVFKNILRNILYQANWDTFFFRYLPKINLSSDYNLYIATDLSIFLVPYFMLHVLLSFAVLVLPSFTITYPAFYSYQICAMYTVKIMCICKVHILILKFTISRTSRMCVRSSNSFLWLVLYMVVDLPQKLSQLDVTIVQVRL